LTNIKSVFNSLLKFFQSVPSDLRHDRWQVGFSELANLRCQIDNLLYQLYDITEEERKIIEGEM